MHSGCILQLDYSYVCFGDVVDHSLVSFLHLEHNYLDSATNIN